MCSKLAYNTPVRLSTSKPACCMSTVYLQVKQFYTAPTAIRSLMRSGETFVKQHNRDSLQVIGTVGEPINPEAWRWYHDVVSSGYQYATVEVTGCAHCCMAWGI